MSFLVNRVSVRAHVAARGYAAQAKTAIKSGKNALGEADMPALGPLALKPTTKATLPDVSDMTPDVLGIRWKKHWESPHHTKVRSVDVVLREQYDAEAERWALFDQQMKIGTIMMVESVTSRTVPRRQVVAGVVIDKQYCGVASHFTVMSLIAGTLVTLQMPLYNPNVLRMKKIGEFSEQELVDNGLIKSGSIRQIFNKQDEQIHALADRIRDRADKMKEDRMAGKKNPTRQVQEQMLKAEYVQEAKVLMKELRRDIKAYRRGPEVNRTWKGWSEIEELRQRSFL